MKATVFTLSLLAFLFAFEAQIFAVTVTVNQAGDNGDLSCNATCTLRDAVHAANNFPNTQNEIYFAPGLTNITLNSQIVINNLQALLIAGNGANVLTITGSGGGNRLFLVRSSGVFIRGVTLTGGSNNGTAVGTVIRADESTLGLEEVVVQNNQGGGGVGAVAFSGGTTRIINSTFSGNTGFNSCAAIHAESVSLTIVNTTVSGNSTLASGNGIGAICFFSGSATIRSTTISGNAANGTLGLGGGGIFIDDTANVDLGNTIVAGNTSAGNGPDLYRQTSTSTFTTSGGNLIGDNTGNPSAPNTTTFPTGNPNANGDKVGTTGSVINPMLDILRDNGGTTPTRALLAGSPALDAGINSLATAAGLTTDQRGFSRFRDGNGNGSATIDSGAFEAQLAPTAASVTISGRVLTPEGRGLRNAVMTLTDASGTTRATRTTTFGYFRFAEVPAGETYIIQVFSKRYRFAAQVVTVNEDLTELNFVSQSPEAMLRQ